MWNVKTKVIPVIAGANGTISQSFRKYLSNMPGNITSRKYRFGMCNVKIQNVYHGKQHHM
jgi:hypothetical protein